MKVWGGMTGAGCKQPLKSASGPWTCSHGHENKGYARRCLMFGCNEWRPDAAPKKAAA